jgi:cytochrome P450
MAGPIDLYSPDSYVDAPPHAEFEYLRRTQPVYWQDVPDGEGYWALLKHVDIVHVAGEPRLFSGSEGGVTLADLSPEDVEVARNQLVSMDPPRHRHYRQPLTVMFKRRTIARLEARIRRITQAILANAADVATDRGHVEFVHDVCSSMPSQVFGELAGVPPADWGHLHELAEQMFRSEDPDVTSSEDDMRLAATEMATYGMQFAARRRTEPQLEDLTTLILDSDFCGQPMDDVMFGSFFMQLAVAGNDTTVSMLSAGVLTLLQHPDQLAQLRAEPSLIPSAIEEILRYANPVHYMRRTATADTELRGVPIKAGDKLAMIYTSANRDEDVFTEPQSYDIRRSPNPHLAFGIAEHFCLGAHLTRLEGKVFFEELLAGFPTIELVGEPKRVRSNHNNALKELPIALRRR